MTGRPTASSDAPSIEKASDTDIELLAGLIRSSFTDVAERFGLTPHNCPKHPSNCSPQWIKSDLARGVRYYVLRAGSTALGCVGVEKAAPTTCYMERLAVLAAHRGKGYGSRLARHAMRTAHDWDASSVEIGIIAADARLKAFYASLGFEEGRTKTFSHLPFRVAFMHIAV